MALTPAANDLVESSGPWARALTASTRTERGPPILLPPVINMVRQAATANTRQEADHHRRAFMPTISEW
jgi:hypothetical protein